MQATASCQCSFCFFLEHTTGGEASNYEDSAPEYLSGSVSRCCGSDSAIASFGVSADIADACDTCRDSRLATAAWRYLSAK